MEKVREQLTVVFLGDSYPPTKLVLLKRASSKRWAADMYTGIGGHREHGENIKVTAKRELNEETGICRVPLIEFARGIVEDVSLHYFWGVWENNLLPSCNEGDLEWVKIPNLLNKDIIPTTLIIIQEWQRRRFNIKNPWTMYLGGEVDSKGITRDVVVKSIKDTLVPVEST